MRSNARRSGVEQDLVCIELDGSVPRATGGFKSRQFDWGSICTNRCRWPGRDDGRCGHTHCDRIGIHAAHGTRHGVYQLHLAFSHFSGVEGVGRFVDTRSAPTAHLAFRRGKSNSVILVASGIQRRCCGIGKGNRGNKGDDIVLASGIIAYHHINRDHRRARMGHDERSTRGAKIDLTGPVELVFTRCINRSSTRKHLEPNGISVARETAFG